MPNCNYKEADTRIVVHRDDCDVKKELIQSYQLYMYSSTNTRHEGDSGTHCGYRRHRHPGWDSL